MQQGLDPAGDGRSAATTAVSAVTATVAATALFGTVGTARVLGPDVSAWPVAAARLGLGGGLLLAVALLAGVRLATLRALWRRPAVWAAAVGMASFQVSFLAAVAETGVAVGTLLAIGSAPLFTGVITRHVDRVWALTTGLALVGLTLLVLGGGGGGALTPGGVALALLAGASYATYAVASSALRAAGALAAPAAVFVVAGALGVPVLLFSDLAWLVSPGGAGMVLYLAVVPTVLSYILLARGLRVLAPSAVATLGLTEPVVAAALGVLVLGERIPALGLTGAVLLVTALGVFARASTRPVPGAALRLGD